MLIEKFKKLRKKVKTEYLLLCLILLYSFYLRITYLDNDSLWLDETLSAVTAKGIIEHGYPMLESGYVHNRALLFHYGMAFFINVFGGDFGARFISVIFGVLTVYLAYLFSKEFIKKSNWVFPLIIAVSSLEIVYSKQARFYQAFQFFYFLSFYLFYKIVIKKRSIFGKKWLDYSLILISVLLSMHLHLMGFIIPVLLLLIYFIHNFDKGLLKKRGFYLILLSGVLLLFLILFQLKYLISWNFFTGFLIYYNFFIDSFLEYTLFFIFSLIGAFFAFKEDAKFTTSLLVYSIIPFFGVFFVKLYGLRYVYFILFTFFFFISFFFKKLKFKTIFLLIFFILFSTSVFSFKGVESLEADPSVVLADFKGAYAFINSLNSTLPVVSGWTPASEWYWKGADYGFDFASFPPYENYFNYEGREKFTNNSIIYNISDFPNNFLLVINGENGDDGLVLTWFSFSFTNFEDYFYSHCDELFSGLNIGVYNCTNWE